MNNPFFYLKLLYKLGRLRCSPLWRVARAAVQLVMHNWDLQKVAKDEPHLRFCPQCGQIPDGDRRMDEARTIAMRMLQEHGLHPKRKDIDFALQFWYWMQ